jgi:hypothetical protein
VQCKIILRYDLAGVKDKIVFGLIPAEANDSFFRENTGTMFFLSSIAWLNTGRFALMK